MTRNLLYFLFASVLFAGTDDSFLLRNVTVHTVSGGDLQGAAVLVRDGKIAGVGSKLSAPKGVRIVEGRGLHVYPGMIDSASEIGLSEIGAVGVTVDTTEIGPFNPQLRAAAAVNPASEHIPVTRANGITSVIVLPDGGVLSGQAALMHLSGWTWESMQFRAPVAFHLNFPSLGTTSGVPPARPFKEVKADYERRLDSLKDFFEQARRYQTARKAGDRTLAADLKFEAMLPVLEGKVPLLVEAEKAETIRAAIDFASREKVKIILGKATEARKAAKEIKAAGIPVILEPTLALPPQEDDPYDEAFTLPADLFNAGIKFAFGTYSAAFSRDLPYSASMAAAFGLPQQEALRAVTLNAAEIWGVAGQLGSIDTGKWADLMVTDGDPLEARTQVKYVFIKGKAIDVKDNKHYRLFERYMNRP